MSTTLWHVKTKHGGPDAWGMRHMELLATLADLPRIRAQKEAQIAGAEKTAEKAALARELDRLTPVFLQGEIEENLRHYKCSDRVLCYAGTQVHTWSRPVRETVIELHQLAAQYNAEGREYECTEKAPIDMSALERSLYFIAQDLDKRGAQPDLKKRRLLIAESHKPLHGAHK